MVLVPVELDDPWRPEPLRSTETERLRATASEPSLPRLARLSPPRTAPSRSSQQPRQPRRPLPQQGPPLDAAAPGDMTLQEWMQAISAPQGAIGMQVRRAELPGRSSASSHRPLVLEAPRRSPAAFANVMSKRPLLLGPETGVVEALLGGPLSGANQAPFPSALRPSTSSSSTLRLKAELPVSVSDKALLRQVKVAKPHPALNRASTATELGVGLTDNAAIVAHSVKVGHRLPSEPPATHAPF